MQEKKHKSALADLESIRNVLKNIQNENLDDQIEERRVKIENLEREKEEMEALYSSKRVHMENIKTNLDHDKQNMDNLRYKIKGMESKARNCQDEIRQMEKGGNNRLAIFDPKMPRFVSELKKMSDQFQKMPIGPLGMEVKLKKDVSQKEAGLIESEIGSILSKLISFLEIGLNWTLKILN